MIDPYKYHLAIGNQEGPNILTERVTDAFLGHAVPIAFGCSNLANFFPPESFLAIDIHRPDAAIAAIKQVIYDEDDYARRLPAVIEARRRVIEEYNIVAMIAHVIKHHDNTQTTTPSGGTLYTRRQSRLRHPGDLAGFLRFKLGTLRSPS